jgi:predicted ATP-grasp superfamily ATP-dependent carboligase
MKILLTDIFNRKSFDIINILSSHFRKLDFIFTLTNNDDYSKFRLRNIYNTTKYYVLSEENFDFDLSVISRDFSNKEIVFLPIEENTISLFLRHMKNNEQEKFRYLLPTLEDFELSRNKMRLNIFCENNNISCPKYITREVLETGNFNYPIIKKPKHGSGAKDIVYIENKKDLNKCSIDFEIDFIQERLPNPKDIEAGFYLCKEGEVISFYSHKRIRTYPKTGGVSIYSKAEYNKELESIGGHLLKQLNWSGFVMVEYLYDRTDNKYKLIEINPRLWGSIMLSEFCNANFLRDYLDIALGREVVKSEVNTNTYIRWVFPYDFVFWINNICNPLKFFKRSDDTCYINFSYTTFITSWKFIMFTYMDFNKLKRIFRID